MPVAHLKTVDLNYLQLPQKLSPFDSLLNPPDQREPGIEGEQDSQNDIPSNLVMVHGLATNLAFWYHLALELSVTHPVTLFDLRGHGRSSMPENGYTPRQMAEDLRELLDYLGIETAHLMAHSFGGSVILDFACAYPERVESLILVDVRLRVLQPRQRLRDWPRWKRTQRILNRIGVELDEDDPESGYQILEAIARLQMRLPKGKHRLRRLLSKLVPENSQRTASRWLKLLETTSARRDLKNIEGISLEQLQQINKHTLAIYGESSPTVPTANALKEVWTHAHFEFVPLAGHFFPVSQPQALITSVERFLKQLNYLDNAC